MTEGDRRPWDQLRAQRLVTSMGELYLFYKIETKLQWTTNRKFEQGISSKMKDFLRSQTCSHVHYKCDDVLRWCKVKTLLQITLQGHSPITTFLQAFSNGIFRRVVQQLKKISSDSDS